jgi:fructose-bisphosphate aldolase, class II
MLEEFLKKSALGAFNLDSFETLKAICLVRQAVIVEVSPGELNYLGMRNVASLVDNARREFDIPIFLNLDHAEDLDIIKKALDFGFSLVHFDGGKLSLEDNISAAKQVVSWAHEKEVLVEGEIDTIGGKITDPETAKRFVAETGVDIFAVSIGNKHGVGENEKLDLELLQKIHEALPNTFLSLHGGSGIADEEVKAAIKLGVVKINVNTELRIAFKNNLDLTKLAWYEVTKPAIVAVQKIVENKIRLFESGGKII